MKMSIYRGDRSPTRCIMAPYSAGRHVIVGDCFIARVYKEILDTATLTAILDHVFDIVGNLGSKRGGTAIAQKCYNKAGLDRFIERPLQMQHAYHRKRCYDS